MNQRKKILVIQPLFHDRSHDSNDLVEQMIAAFPKSQFEITTLFIQGTPPSVSTSLSHADHTVYLDIPDHEIQGLRLKLRWTLYKFCQDKKFDAVICNRYKPVLLMMQIDRWLRTPLYIGISHGLGEYKTLRRRLLARWHINENWHFIGVSQSVTDYLTGQNCGFTNENTSTIDNAIDVSATEEYFLPRTQARSELGISEDVCLVGAIGRLVKVKGHNRLIHAFSLIHSKFPNARLLIIGDGKEKTFLSSEIKSLGLSEKIFLPGFRPQAARFATAFDILVMPSFSEGLPRALLEGMSARLPIIGSDIPALKSLIEGAGGLTFSSKSNDIASLAEALESYLAMPLAARQAAGDTTYRYVRAHHDLHIYQKKYLQLILKELGKRSSKEIT